MPDFARYIHKDEMNNIALNPYNIIPHSNVRNIPNISKLSSAIQSQEDVNIVLEFLNEWHKKKGQ